MSGKPGHRRVLVEMPERLAEEMFPDGFAASARSGQLDAVERDLERVRSRSPELADGALAASLRAMAYEIDNPYNSATSKSMCQARLADALKELRELLPPERKKDGVDDLAQRRNRRRAGLAGSATA